MTRYGLQTWRGDVNILNKQLQTVNKDVVFKLGEGQRFNSLSV
jgi:hypothetical protein